MKLASICCAALLGLSAPQAMAGCWVVANLSGYGAMPGNDYDFEEDAITNGRFEVKIDGKNSSLTNVGQSFNNDSGQKYLEISNNTMVLATYDGINTSVDTWTITEDGKALNTLVRNWAQDHRFTAARAFTGDVVGRCD